MKIKSILTYLVEIPYKSVYKTATNTTPVGRHVVVKINTDSDLFGWGETGIISILHPSQGDSPESMFSVINNYLAPSLLGLNPTEIGLVIKKMERTIRGNYFAKCAIDHAVYDITGKALGISAAKMLGGMHNTKFYVSRSLPLGTPKEVTEKAKEFKDNGYRMLTLKGGIDYKNDIECFKMTRKVVGEDFMLEIDPNGGYDRATALKTIKELEQYNLQSIEQPIAGIDVEGMAELRRKVNTPIIADESVFTMYDLTNIIEKKAADIICLKPFKSGGLFLSKKMQCVSESFNLQVSTGSIHPFGIGTCGLHQFISTVSEPILTGYGCPSERFIDDIADETCYTFKNGEVVVNEKPGLGVVVNEKKLKKYTCQYQKVE